MLRRRSALAAIIAAWICSSVAAQELTTDAERDWRAVRSSDDTRTKIMAERWYNAIRQQDWADATGKFKTSAKYVDHDPNFAWVKLRVIRGAGKERVVKDVQIPLDKLSKACQARVRTISVLKEKIAEAKEDEAKKEAEEEVGTDAAGGRGGEPLEGEPPADEAMPEKTRGGRGGFDRGLAGMDPREVVAESEQPPVITNNGPPLPALRPTLPTGGAAPPSASDPSIPAGVDAGPENLGGRSLPMSADAWRTNYEDFRGNIKVHQRGREIFVFDWGPMTGLENAYQTNKRWEDFGSVGEEALAEISAALDAVGEVQWEATLQQTPTPDGDWNAILGLPPLPEPWELSYVLDSENDPGAWQELKAGDRVRFTGRFDAFDETYSIVVAIRFPATAAAVGNIEGAPAAPVDVTPLADTPNLIDSDPWRTDYEAFRTVFEKDEIGVISTRERWPGVINLQLFIPAELLGAEQRGAEPSFVAVPRLAEVGDFQWEGIIAQQPTAEANWAEVLGLTPLVEPLKLELRLQDTGRSSNWQQFQIGDRVRVVGRFVGYRGQYGWVAEIRLLPGEAPRR